mmetsp:Transcript_72675/g.151799  ORF Transcript_72675/g.151799 Transcript_72675/m.151799 type:complete len:231 (-) Transcript_72675:236-928(-)|eukprot:CAMPEP_0181304860 /NCGR_PEP_ID=MMETSP1101-20121128/9394_1 /TAXON_ID=46948 /ORGANISM="Rhodomonas abbreviata, Strain Caron Lab Isolate" /LENGTH=230 /DNA_ID=CAMNT_0023410683 /DNA_START=71 /DNA_END=763 /DNA_ORIENTATION=-
MPPKDAKGKKEAAPPPPVEDENQDEKFGQWEGKLNDMGIPEGKGEATYPNGDLYSGEIRDAKRQGQGKYVWKAAEEGKHGGVYEGEYDGNKKNGKGQMKYPDNGTYDGQWQDGLRHGNGTFKYPNGDWYKGQWHSGLKSGEGTYFSYSGACWYMGQWESGEFQKGDWKFKDGSCYKGLFKGGRPAAGEGVFVFPNGNNLKGKWVETPLEGSEEGATTTVWVGGELIVPSA